MATPDGAGDRASSPAEWLFRHAARTPRAEALDAPGTRLAYSAVAERVAVLAGDLATRGAGPADRVVVALPFSPAAAIATLAVQAIGACAVEIDPRTTARTLASILSQTRPRFAIVHARDAATWAEACSDDRRLEWAWATGPRLSDGAFPARGTTPLGPACEPAVPARPIAGPAPVTAGAPALVVYTSGSTRAPHGVVQTYGNVETNTRAIVSFLGLSAADRAMALLPFHYCYGKSVLQTHLFVGASLFVEPRFMYPRIAIAALGTEECTGLAGVPLTFELLRREVDVRSFSHPALRYVTQAGGRMHATTLTWARAAFAPARLYVMYGQTEATARLAFLPPERAADKEGSVGIAVPDVELRVVDDAGRERPAGELGQLVARGPSVTPGYLDAPEETAAILHDGWLWTGDLARRDADGFLFLAGRAREILKVGGYRVVPDEIEEALAAHPAVADAAVVGAPDDLEGEVAVAFVELRPGASATERDLRSHCLQVLGRVKVPTRVVAVDALPRSAAGKPLKPVLRERARELMSALAG
ncbi:class I adenylate-forming enzyme family protein [Anaeromyxobacter oryzae]|uniref:AMP-dependent ligase n=1 Tax=Anaeromyxobacter oryzae TaxID=2918170 RepID=A0ABN6N4D3_9BACT|nr:class I adenylate-forming enzyme family protein [Anaeromyxobacter oryzae]BDG06817.1 AMP-dependent ligase [Anaeromyxobacter oryzae]